MTARPRRITAPISDADLVTLRAGERILLSGTIYTARDAAHKMLTEALDRGEKLPIQCEGCVLYYVGPTPAKPGYPIGSAGPTTSGRMDAYSPRLMKLGFRAMIGKGARSQAVKDSIVETKSVYLAAIGGAGALLGKSIKQAEVVAYPELGPEAIHRLVVEDMPLVVVNDSMGGDLYTEGRNLYRVG